MSKKQSKRKAVESQSILPGILTEREVFCAMMRKIGAKGGAVNSPAQQETRMIALQKAWEVRRQQGREKRKK